MAAWAVDLVVLSAAVLFVGCSAGKVDLPSLLNSKYRHSPEKRMDEGNPCPEPEKPWPCKNTPTCIPMGYVCDHNIDCEDGYDEDPDVCTAAHRPPVEDIMQFLEAEKSWIIPNLFGGKNLAKIAHGLAVSQTVDDFKRRIGLSTRDIRNLKFALSAVEHGMEEDLEDLGMPASAWNEVSFFFSKLVKSGFA